MNNTVTTLDLCEKLYPILLIETNREIMNIDNGETIKLIATDPMTPKVIKLWCESTGNTLISSTFDDQEYKYKILIEKTVVKSTI